MTDFPEKCLRKIPFVLLTEDNKSSVAQREHFFEYQEFAFENYYDLKNIKLLFSEDEYLVFSILLSHDKKKWKNVYTNTISNENRNYFDIDIISNHVKFVKIRLDRPGFLKIKDVSFWGDSSSSSFKEDPVLKYKTAFSVLFNESPTYLEKLIKNFLMFTDENCFLFINLSKNLTIDENFFFCSPRVFLFYGDIKRDKSGNTLLLGHLESIRAVIRSNLEIRYFCTLASNSLFIRKFSLDDTINQLHQKHQVPVSIERNYINDLDVCFGSIPDNGTWMWEHIANATSLHEHLQKKMDLDNLSVTQIEGLFAELSEWLLVEKYFKEIEEIAFYLKGVLWTAFEECIPVSIFRKHGKSEFTNICYMMWDGYRTASSSDVIKYNQCLPEHLCLLKWFERDIKNPATKMVTSDWGYHFLSLLNIKEILNNDELFTIETNLCNTSGKNLRKNNLCKNDFYLILKDRLINRDRIDIKDVCINSSLDSGFILLEHKNFQADIICQSLNGKFYVSATSISPQEKNQIIGYIYLECHITHPIFQISLDEKNDFLIENIVIYDGLNFTRLNPSPSKHDINLVYNFAKLCKDDSILYLGIPIFLEKSFYINIDVLY